MARCADALAPEYSLPFRMKTSWEFFTSVRRKSIFSCSAAGRAAAAKSEDAARRRIAAPATCLRATVVLHQLEQSIDPDRFLQVVRAEGLRLLDGAPVRRHDHDRDRLQLRVAELLRPELPAVHDRHHEVQKDDARALGAGLLESDLTVFGRPGRVPRVREYRADAVAQSRVVFDDEYAGCGGRHREDRRFCKNCARPRVDRRAMLSRWPPVAERPRCGPGPSSSGRLLREGGAT